MNGRKWASFKWSLKTKVNSVWLFWHSKRCVFRAQRIVIALWLEMQINYIRKMGHTAISYEHLLSMCISTFSIWYQRQLSILPSPSQRKITILLWMLCLSKMPSGVTKETHQSTNTFWFWLDSAWHEWQKQQNMWWICQGCTTYLGLILDAASFYGAT